MDADHNHPSHSHRRRHQYSAAVRASAVAAVQEGLASGRSLASLAREMRLPATTVQRWVAGSRASFRAVTIAATPLPAPHEPGLVLCTAHGHRLEGLDVATAILVLRALEAGG
jgi:hypothetical protein